MSRATAIVGLVGLAVVHQLVAESTSTRSIEIMSITEPHRYISWIVSEAKLVDESLWDSRREVPLSRERAIQLARSDVRSRGEPSELPVTHSDLKHPAKIDVRIPCYFYFISFDDLSQVDAPKHLLDVVVLLDGSVVPATVKWRKGHSSNQSLEPTATRREIHF